MNELETSPWPLAISMDTTLHEELGSSRLRLLNVFSRDLLRGDVHERCRAALRAVSTCPAAIAFAELHLLDRDSGCYQPVMRDDDRLPTSGWPIEYVAHSGRPVCADHVADHVSSAWVMPVHVVGEAAPLAVFVAGMSPRQRRDPEQQTFVQLLTRELASALTDARLSEERGQDDLRRLLFTTSPVAICAVTGPEHRYVLANRSYCEMVNKHDLLGRAITDVWPEIVGTTLLAVFDSVYRTGEPYVAPEFTTALDRDGDGVVEECFFSFNLVASRDRAGVVTGWTCSAAEITAQVRARREAEAARREAERASRAKDEFIAILGHELRNPLSPITTALFLMEKHGDDRTREERTTIQRQVDHLVRLVDDLLDVSRVTGGKVRLTRRPIELADVVDKALEMVAVLLSEREQVLTVEVPRAGLAVFGDLARLAQVVSNLLTNAAKYTHRGGSIRVDATRDGAEVVLTVRDSGMGIRPEMLPRVFGMFEQERQALDRSMGGLGIGLAIVRGLVEMHEGKVSAHSDGVGLGSRFEVRLPELRAEELRQSMAVAAPRAKRVLPARPPLRARILVVDDNRDAAQTLASVLRDMGQEVEVAFDGPGALELVRSFQPALALLDIGLPVMDGYRLAVALRQALHPRRVRLVAVTGYGQASDRDRAFAVGFDAHVVKPLRPEMMESILADLEAELETS